MAEQHSTEEERRAFRYESRIEAAVEEQRQRMMQAEAVINCLIIVLRYGEDEKEYGGEPMICILTELAGGLIKEAIEGLDSVNVLGRKMGKASSEGNAEDNEDDD